jgi:cytochrome c oxidase subunit 3
LSVVPAGTRNARADRETLPIRAHPLVFGVVIFLASELMFFAALFAAYYDLRAEAPAGSWPPPGVRLDLLDSSIGTALLVASSLVTMAMARALRRGRTRAARAWLLAALACALTFVAIALSGYARDTFSIASNAYGSLFFTMTGFHLLHVAAGIVLLAGMFLGLRSPAMQANRQAGAEAITYYWHFVLVVWLGIWGTIYFVR